MKKTFCIIGLVLCAVLVGYLSLYFVCTTPFNDGSFELSDYSDCIDDPNFQDDKNYGEITNYKTAAKIGNEIFAERFEESKSSLFLWRGCAVKYDSNNSAWYVRTFIIAPVFGGAHDVIISSNGDVLAVWGEK